MKSNYKKLIFKTKRFDDEVVITVNLRFWYLFHVLDQKIILFFKTVASVSRHHSVHLIDIDTFFKINNCKINFYAAKALYI